MDPHFASLPILRNDLIFEAMADGQYVLFRSLGSRRREMADRAIKTTIASADIPDRTPSDDAILKDTIECAGGTKNNTLCTAAFRLTQKELGYYRKQGVALPKFCPNCRHFKRLARRQQRNLWTRQCSNATQSSAPCKNTFLTSFSPQSTATILCDECYKAKVY